MTTVALPPVAALADMMVASGAFRMVAIARLCACSRLRRCWVWMNRPPRTSATRMNPPAIATAMRGARTGQDVHGERRLLAGARRLGEHLLAHVRRGRHRRDGRQPAGRLPQAASLLAAGLAPA